MIVRDHRLEGVPFKASPNHSGPIVPELIVCHYTATQNGPGTIAALCSERLKASAHLVIDTDGMVTQLVPFNVKAWHAGKSEWAGRSGLNGWSIGIEIVNPGPLKAHGDQFVDVYDRPFHGEVFRGKHKNQPNPYAYWARYTEQQMRALIECGRALIATYGITEAIGHDDCSPGRKMDPGPAFDWDRVRAAWFPSVEAETLKVLRNGEVDAVLPVAAGATVSWEPDSMTLSIQEGGGEG